jgi:hypothetical protein
MRALSAIIRLALGAYLQADLCGIQSLGAGRSLGFVWTGSLWNSGLQDDGDFFYVVVGTTRNFTNIWHCIRVFFHQNAATLSFAIQRRFRPLCP